MVSDEGCEDFGVVMVVVMENRGHYYQVKISLPMGRRSFRGVFYRAVDLRWLDSRGNLL
jgi:hypothetical protein